MNPTSFSFLLQLIFKHWIEVSFPLAWKLWGASHRHGLCILNLPVTNELLHAMGRRACIVPLPALHEGE